jgi:hypothetical protein
MARNWYIQIELFYLNFGTCPGEAGRNGKVVQMREAAKLEGMK